MNLTFKKNMILFIIIVYYMAKNENDTSNFSRNQYLRSGEIINYFNPDVWDVISVIEEKSNTIHNGHPFHPKTHEHRVGHIFAKKKIQDYHMYIFTR